MKKTFEIDEFKQFNIEGLSQPNSATLLHNGNLFWAKFIQGFDFMSLFQQMKNNWTSKKILATLAYKKQTPDGTPIDAVITKVDIVEYEKAL